MQEPHNKKIPMITGAKLRPSNSKKGDNISNKTA